MTFIHSLIKELNQRGQRIASKEGEPKRGQRIASKEGEPTRGVDYAALFAGLAAVYNRTTVPDAALPQLLEMQNEAILEDEDE